VNATIHARRRAGGALATAGLLLALLTTPASAASLETLVQDDANLLHRPAEQVAASMARLKALGVDRVRLTANWSVLTRDTDAEQPPVFDAADPAAYEQARWRGLDRAVVAAHEAGLQVLIDLGFWAPHWATDDPPGPRARTNVDPAAYAAFVQAAVRRYDGKFAPAPDAGPPPPPSQDETLLEQTFGPTGGGHDGGSAADAVVDVAPLPAVTQFALWNEPNHPSLLLPQWSGTGAAARPASPVLYRRMLAAAVPAARAARPEAELLIGNTSSSGGHPGSGAVAPLRFVRELACVDRALRPLRTPACANFKPIDGDGWAHHPYSRNRRPDAPTRADRPDDVSIADLGKLSALLDALAARGRIAPGLRRIHVTEFGYETEPIAGRPTLDQATQARWLTWAERLATSSPGVVSFAQFLLRDQPPAPTKVSDSPARAFGQYGTGLDRADGTPKLAAASFVAGLFARTAGPRQAQLWARLRLAPGPHTIAVEERRGPRWRQVVTRPAGGGPATRSFSMDGHDAVTRGVVRHAGSRFRLVTPGADGARVRGIEVAAMGPPPAPRR